MAQPIVRSLWRLVRGERTAYALVHEWPHGHELRVLVDNELRWSQLYRGSTREADAGQEAERKAQALRDTGWLSPPSNAGG